MESVGRYAVAGRLGSGAFATVFQGHDPDLDVDVAIKVLADNWTSDGDVRARFVAEARLLRVLNHPRIVRVHDIGELPDGRPYFVMDLATGGTLAELENAPIDEVLRLCAEVAEAVQVLHDHDQLHRDIKPSNVLLTHDRNRTLRVVLADLGLAKALSEVSRVTVTAGSPGYVAPEQVNGLGELSVRTDVYSLGAMATAALVGRPPFAETGLYEVATRDPALRPQPIAQSIGVSSALDDLLARSLSYDPSRRPATAADFAREITRLGDSLTDTTATNRAVGLADDAELQFTVGQLDADAFEATMGKPLFRSSTAVTAHPGPVGVPTWQDEPTRQQAVQLSPAEPPQPPVAPAPAPTRAGPQRAPAASSTAAVSSPAAGSSAAVVWVGILIFLAVAALTWFGWRSFG